MAKKKKKATKKRASTYEKKTVINASFHDILNASVKDAEEKMKSKIK